MAKIKMNPHTPDQTVATNQVRHLIRERALLRNERTQLLEAAERITEIEAMLGVINAQITATRPRLPPGAEDDE